MRSPWLRLLPMLFCIFLVACASGPSRSITTGTSLPAPDTTTATGAYEGQTEYRLGPQDLIEVSVFGVDDLNKDVRVNSNGQISLPLIGSVLAGGRTIPQLEADLAKAYSQGFLQNPQVTIFVKEFASQRITLEGAIEKPGIYPLTGKTTLLQAVAVAGGVTPLADLNGVVVFRQVDGKRAAAVYRMRDLRSGTIEDPQLYGDDMIVVEQSGSKTAFRRIIESVPVFGIFRWY